MTDYSLPIVPRYAEVDQQAVVFNGHYLTWFDEAVTGFFDHLGTSYPDLMDAGLDMQVVRTESTEACGSIFVVARSISERATSVPSSFSRLEGRRRWVSMLR